MVKSVALSHDDKRVLTGGSEKLLRIFDIEKVGTSPTATATIEGHTQSIRVTLWPSPHTPDIIVSGGEDSQIRVWDLRAGSVGEQMVKSIATKAPITSIELTYDQKYLLSTAGNEVSFWDPTTFDLVKTFTLGVETRSASLHPNSSRFVTGGADSHVHVYDFASGNELEVHKGHHGSVHCVKFAPDGHLFASGSEDGTIRLWQTIVMPYRLWQLSGSSNNSSTHSTKQPEELETGTPIPIQTPTPSSQHSEEALPSATSVWKKNFFFFFSFRNLSSQENWKPTQKLSSSTPIFLVRKKQNRSL